MQRLYDWVRYTGTQKQQSWRPESLVDEMSEYIIAGVLKDPARARKLIEDVKRRSAGEKR